jgi:hypothetical protein
MIRQAFGEESTNCTRKVETHRGRKETRQMKSKAISMLIIFFDIKGIVHKEFDLPDQTLNSAYFCDILGRMRENMRRLRPEIWLEKSITTTLFHTSFFTREFFHEKQHEFHSPTKINRKVAI